MRDLHTFRRTAIWAMQNFTQTLISIANDTVPRTSLHKNSRQIPWFDDKRKEAIKERGKKTERLFFRHPSTEVLIKFKMSRAQARRTINEVKKESWRIFFFRLSTSTPSNKIWNLIRK